MVKTLVAFVAFVAFVSNVACVGSKGCPCGQDYSRDPLDPEAAFYVSADHDASEHCYCRCGEGPKVRFPPSQTCEGFEGACEAADGTIAQLTCE